ncbi:MAG TPA: hypothetical protein VFN88_09360 [Caulobacteraceae bacterium]|nr:hypothetical protein [Caulobacteraceae bacterium]
MKIDGSFVLIGVLIIALGIFGYWQYQRVSKIHVAPPPPEKGVRVPLIF